MLPTKASYQLLVYFSIVNIILLTTLSSAGGFSLTSSSIPPFPSVTTTEHRLHRFATSPISKTEEWPEVEWNNSYGGTENDECYGVCQTQDGGYVCIGITDSYGDDDLWVLKTNATGVELWNQSYGGSEWDIGVSALELTDGSLILLGITKSYGTGKRGDAWLLKTDAYGNEIWNKTYGGSELEEVYTILQTSDHGYLFGGITESYGAGSADAWIVRTNAQGEELWNKTYGGEAWDWIGIEGIAQTSSGEFVFVGQTESYATGKSDLWVVYANENGNKKWQKTYGDTGLQLAFAVQICGDGTFAVAGMTDSKGAGAQDIWLLKINKNGTLLWDKTYGGTGYDDCWAIQQTLDRGYLLIGSTYSYGSQGRSIWVVKTDAEGREQWNQSFGNSEWDQPTSVRLTKDRGVIVCGFSDVSSEGLKDEFVLIKFETLPSPILQKSVTDGIGITAHITNCGEHDAENASIHIQLRKGLLKRIIKDTSQTVPLLPADNSSIHSLSTTPLGLGKLDVLITTGADNAIYSSESHQAFLFFIWCFLL